MNEQDVKIADTEASLYLASLHLYDDTIVFQAGHTAYCVDPHDVAQALTGLHFATGPLPRNCLAYVKLNGQERLVVYVEPRVWPVSVRGEKETWHVPLPGLVFVGQGQDYNLWAVKRADLVEGWPGPDTRLYDAPCPNVGSRGICRGSAPFPVASAATIWQAVEVFFSSGFNRDLSNGKSRKHWDCVLDMWREVRGKRKYPEGDLVVTGHVLRDVVGGDE